MGLRCELLCVVFRVLCFFLALTLTVFFLLPFLRYAGIMGLLFTAGLPCTIAFILIKNRDRLKDEKFKEDWGFLYETFGTRAYLWEVEELLRKLWLTAIVVLMPAGVFPFLSPSLPIMCPSSLTFFLFCCVIDV